MSANSHTNVDDIRGAILSLLADSVSGTGAVDYSQGNAGGMSVLPRKNMTAEEQSTSDMVRMIQQHLDGMGSTHSVSVDSTCSQKVSGSGFSGNMHSMGLPVPDYQRRDRSYTDFSSSALSSLRAIDEDLVRGWQPVDEQAAAHEAAWALPEASPFNGDRQSSVMRRATFDDSDFANYRSSFRRPAWKCKHCTGVAWSDDDPCEGCGRYLQDNMVMISSPGYFAAPAPAAREGDWVCVCCGNVNWEWRAQCNRCHTCKGVESANPLFSEPIPETIPAPAPVLVDDVVKQRLKKRLSTHPAGVFKDNDWVCVSCGNINWDWRSKCHQCNCFKPTTTASSAPSVRGPEASAFNKGARPGGHHYKRPVAHSG